MNEIVITVKGLLWICGSIAVVGGATAIISRWLTPFRELKKEVADMGVRLTACEKNQKYDHKEIDKVETGIEKICKCVFAITDHELTGNSVDRLREAKDEMQDYLIQK